MNIFTTKINSWPSSRCCSIPDILFFFVVIQRRKNAITFCTSVKKWPISSFVRCSQARTNAIFLVLKTCADCWYILFFSIAFVSKREINVFNYVQTHIKWLNSLCINALFCNFRINWCFAAVYILSTGILRLFFLFSVIASCEPIQKQNFS